MQTSFLFYGGITTLMLTFFAIRFDVFDGTLGRTLVGNLAFIGFSQLPGGIILYWAYQILAVALLAAASMTAFQDAQATEWRDVAIGEIPEIIIYRDKRGTFTRSVTITFGVAVLIMLLVRGQTTLAAPFYGIGVFLPIMIMGLAIRQHLLQNYTGKVPRLGSWDRLVCRNPFGIGLHRPTGRQMGRRRLDPFDHLYNLVHLCPPGHPFPGRLPRSQTDPPHRAREGACPGRHGFHRRVAVPAHAGIPLQPAGGNFPLLAAYSGSTARSATTRPCRPAITTMPCMLTTRVRPPCSSNISTVSPALPKLGGPPRQTAPGDEEGKVE